MANVMWWRIKVQNSLERNGIIQFKDSGQPIQPLLSLEWQTYIIITKTKIATCLPFFLGQSIAKDAVEANNCNRPPTKGNLPYVDSSKKY